MCCPNQKPYNDWFSALLTTSFLYVDILNFQTIVTSLKLKNKKAKKPTAQVNLPQDWIPYIQNAKRKNPFSVISMTWQDFLKPKFQATRAIQWFSYGESFEEGEINVKKCGFVILWMFQNHGRK